MAILFIVLDGGGDRLYKGKTALERARTPNIDALTQRGRTGIMDVLSPGVPPGSDTGHWALFGYTESPPGRGVFEAYGYNLPVKKGDVVFRANLAIAKKVGQHYIVKKRRTKGSWDKLRSVRVMGKTVRAMPTLEHRGVVFVKGDAALTDADPGQVGKPMARILAKTKRAEKTAEVMNAYIKKVHKILDNDEIVLLRGAGALNNAPTFAEKWGMKAACVAGGPLYKGVAKYVGMNILEVKGALGTIHSDFRAKYLAAVKALDSNDFVFLHIKATDEASHKKKPMLKAKILEKIDKAFKGIQNLDATVVITADHSTPATGPSHHSGDPVPLLISGKNIIPDNSKKFDERRAARGALGRIKATSLMQILLDAEDRSKEVSFDLSVPSKPYFCDYRPL